jgi:hypothetical protein
MKSQTDNPNLIDITPTPERYVDMALIIISSNPNVNERAWARKELIKAMTIAYAYWYGKSKPEYKLEGIEGK